MAGLGRVLRRTIGPALLALLAGCVSFNYERTIDGRGAFLSYLWRLEPGASTLKDTLERLGPPDLILRAGRVDRAYYASWDSEYLKFIVGATLPVGGRGFSWDLFILSLGGEELRLARLEFDRQGILRDVQQTTFESSQGGQYISLHNTVVSTFLDDRARALRVREEDDDEEDVELDAPRPKPEPEDDSR